MISTSIRLGLLGSYLLNSAFKNVGNKYSRVMLLANRCLHENQDEDINEITLEDR